MARTSDPKDLGPASAKVHPRLRMIRNGDAAVNTIRAEHAACLRVRDPELASRVPCMLGERSVPLASPGTDLPGKLRKKKLRRVPGEVEVSVFVTLSDDASGWSGEFSASSGRLRTTTRPLNSLSDLLDQPYVQFVEPGQALQAPTPAIAADSPPAPSPGQRHFGSSDVHGDGEGVLIGIIDVQGFDFAHPDFLEGGRTRWERIWDQGGAARHHNPDLAIIDVMLRSRLGAPDERSPNPEVDRPFRVWFSSSPASLHIPTRAAHMEAVRQRVRDFQGDAPAGRLSYRFLGGSSREFTV